MTTTTTTTTTASQRTNTFVAESDLKAAIQAIQSRPTHGDPFLKECHESLCRQILNITQPQSDEAFYSYLFHQTHQSESTEQKDEESIVYDEQDLVDPNAMQRAQELRQQVRERSAQLQALKDQVLERALQVTQRNIKLYEKDARSSPNVNIPLDTCHAKIQEMQASLASLQTTLDAVQADLPKSNRLLLETIQTIHKQMPESHTDRAVRMASSSLANNASGPEERLAAVLGV